VRKLWKSIPAATRNALSCEANSWSGQSAKGVCMIAWPAKALRRVFLLAMLALGYSADGALAQTSVDLELVIAVDVSLSMDLDEQRLQREGYVAAFRDDELHKAIASGAHGRIAVTYFEWAGPMVQQVVVPWTIIDGPASAQAFAGNLEKVAISRARMTSIASALEYSGRLFDGSGARGIRRVIDISGDGPNNAGPPVTAIRDKLVAQNIVINGLPILMKRPSSFFDIQNLDRYYTDCVIGGAGAFMIPIKDRAEFLSATRRKLLLEIADQPQPVFLIRIQATAPDPEIPTDCLIGERQWQRYMDGAPN
jgi:hypothetical protein